MFANICSQIKPMWVSNFHPPEIQIQVGENLKKDYLALKG